MTKRRVQMFRHFAVAAVGFVVGMTLWNPAHDLRNRGAQAFENVYLIPVNPELAWGVRFGLGICEDEICRVMTDLVMTLPDEAPRICEDLLMSEAAREAGIVLPEWRTVDYREHLPEVERSVLDSNSHWLFEVTRELTGETLTDARRRELRASLWPTYGERILELFASGAARYQEALFDIDGDAVDDHIYRITMVQPAFYVSEAFLTTPGARPNDPDPDWVVRPCDIAHPTPLYHLYLHPSDEPVLRERQERIEDIFADTTYATTPFRFGGKLYLHKALHTYVDVSTDTGGGGVAVFLDIWRAEIVSDRSEDRNFTDAPVWEE